MTYDTKCNRIGPQHSIPDNQAHVHTNSAHDVYTADHGVPEDSLATSSKAVPCLVLPKTASHTGFTSRQNHDVAHWNTFNLCHAHTRSTHCIQDRNIHHICLPQATAGAVQTFRGIPASLGMPLESAIQQTDQGTSTVPFQLDGEKCRITASEAHAEQVQL